MTLFINFLIIPLFWGNYDLTSLDLPMVTFTTKCALLRCVVPDIDSNQGLFQKVNGGFEGWEVAYEDPVAMLERQNFHKCSSHL